ncbi:hypothetical protein BD626DRAFT_570987 [Schizophyllum amplum]|uniref:Uncharacterized protein n=1 Tax=Schizophyllum amplum TaxID=97359 RepID=A0A550C960_9AGAR|nr:hypothetical protein BD626DRAFT_570987 [Auriculariopsis ampla]
MSFALTVARLAHCHPPRPPSPASATIPRLPRLIRRCAARIPRRRLPRSPLSTRSPSSTPFSNKHPPSLGHFLPLRASAADPHPGHPAMIPEAFELEIEGTVYDSTSANQTAKVVKDISRNPCPPPSSARAS